jgi:hypothetical protein
MSGNQGDKLLQNDCPCRNGGICYTSSSSGKLCQCPNGFTGPFCEISICKFNKINRRRKMNVYNFF